jgi:hypothetical protein
MRAIAKAMGFPPEVWFEEDLGQRRRVTGAAGEERHPW